MKYFFAMIFVQQFYYAISREMIDLALDYSGNYFTIIS